MGKIHGSIWETQIITSLADSYDKIISGTIDNSELFNFLKKQLLPKKWVFIFIANFQVGLKQLLILGTLLHIIQDKVNTH
jgi:hypothetical protein